MAARRGRWWAILRPRRTIRPTREGWWCLLAATGLGFTAVNSGNNLLYLLECMLLALIVVSGIFSELSMRRLRLSLALPDEVYAGRPVLVAARVLNGKRAFASHGIVVEAARAGGPERVGWIARLAPGADRLVTWQQTFPRRGRHRLGGLRATTRFPFGLFTKAGRFGPDGAVVVFPAVQPLPASTVGRLLGSGAASGRRRGRGHDLYNLRDYRPGDDPRLIHWRVTARTGVTTVRELAEEAAADVRIVLAGSGAADTDARERALARAASLAVHVLRRGAGVELIGPGLAVARGRGRGHERALLTALALWEPGAAPGAAPSRGGLAELVVDLDAAEGGR